MSPGEEDEESRAEVGEAAGQPRGAAAGEEEGGWDFDSAAQALQARLFDLSSLMPGAVRQLGGGARARDGAGGRAGPAAASAAAARPWRVCPRTENT